MSNWSYAEMSKRACVAGGPKLYEKSLISEGANSVYPWLGLAVTGVVLLGIDKIVRVIKDNKLKKEAEQNRAVALERKKEILSKIKEIKRKIKGVVIVTTYK